MQTQQAVEYVRTLTAHDHAVAFYDKPEEKWRLISNHLSNGSSALYVCYFEAPDQVRESLEEYGVDVRRAEKHGRFRILELGEHVRNERFDDIASELKFVYAQLAEKSDLVRAAADSTFTVKNGYAAELLRYERWIGRTLGLPIAGLCAYDAEGAAGVGDEFFLELLRLHNHAIFPGMALNLA